MSSRHVPLVVPSNLARIAHPVPTTCHSLHHTRSKNTICEVDGGTVCIKISIDEGETKIGEIYVGRKSEEIQLRPKLRQSVIADLCNGTWAESEKGQGIYQVSTVLDEKSQTARDAEQ